MFLVSVGDVHGQINAMVRMLFGRKSAFGERLTFVFLIRDLDHRHEEDVAMMVSASKYRKLAIRRVFHLRPTLYPVHSGSRSAST